MSLTDLAHVDDAALASGGRAIEDDVPNVPERQVTLSPAQAGGGGVRHETTVMVQMYDDRTLVFVSQTGSLGSLIQVSPPPAGAPQAVSLTHSGSSSSSLLADLKLPHNGRGVPVPSSSLAVAPLFGAAPGGQRSLALYTLYATQIAQLFFSSAQEAGMNGEQVRPVILAIALSHHDTHGSASTTGAGGEDDQDEPVLEISQAERDEFKAVIKATCDIVFGSS